MTTALLYALAAAAANLLGGLVVTTAVPAGRRVQRLLIAFGAGFMLSVTLLAMIPHALEGGEGAALGVVALLGLLLHTFFDGVAIASGFGVSAALGILVFTAIFLHKIPEGVTVASIMLASGNSRRRALAAVALLGAFTLLGVLLTAYVEPLRRHGLALSAGVTLYVAASNLIPEMQKERTWSSALSVFAGFAVFLLARLLFGGLAE